MMKSRTASLAVSISLLALWAVPATGQQTEQTAASAGPLATVASGNLSWSPIQPEGFDAGMEIAVVRGDPAAPDRPYVIRLRFSDGYRFPPHWHPVAENLTVLEGDFLLAMGEQSDESRLQSYRAGDYLFIEPRHPHFGGARGQTVIQLHGMGPFEIIVVGSPQDRR